MTEGAATILTATLLLIMFYGTPDLHDALISYLYYGGKP